MSVMPRCHDVVIVGARVAGASAALHLARQGFDVVVLEKAEELGPVLSSHQMNIVASDCLHHWGIYDDLLRSDCPGIREMVFDIGDVSVTTKVPALGAIDKLHYCKRKVLDNILARHAVASGACMAYGTRFLGIVRMDDHEVELEVEDDLGNRQHLRTRFLIGADGRTSSVAKAMKAPVYNVMAECALTCFGYYDGVITDRLEIHMRNHKSVALFPTNEGQTCLVLAHQVRNEAIEALDKEAFFNAAISDMPSLLQRLGHQASPARLYRFNGADSYFRQPYAGRCALIGDAGYFRDPIIGDGLSDAMLSAELLSIQLSKALRGAPVNASLELFKQVRDQHFTAAYERTRKMLRFDYDFEGLNRQVSQAPSGRVILKKVFDSLLGANRRTRRELLEMLASAELEAA